MVKMVNVVCILPQLNFKKIFDLLGNYIVGALDLGLELKFINFTLDKICKTQ